MPRRRKTMWTCRACGEDYDPAKRAEHNKSSCRVRAKAVRILSNATATVRKAGSDGKFASAHYGGADNPYEAIKVIEAWGYDKDFYIGTLLRYICRAGKKVGSPTVEDLEKASWYLSRKIKSLDVGRPSGKKPENSTKKFEKAFKALSVIPRKSKLHMNR